MKTLSNKQFEIMQIIWGEGTLLTFSMICDKTEMSGKKIRKTLDRLQRKGFLGINSKTEFFVMSQYYKPSFKADPNLLNCKKSL